jgi:hypothetical protein
VDQKFNVALEEALLMQTSVQHAPLMTIVVSGGRVGEDFASDVRRQSSAVLSAEAMNVLALNVQTYRTCKHKTSHHILIINFRML